MGPMKSYQNKWLIKLTINITKNHFFQPINDFVNICIITVLLNLTIKKNYFKNSSELKIILIGWTFQKVLVLFVCNCLQIIYSSNAIKY